LDKDAPKVADIFYGHLFRDKSKEPGVTEAAEAFHRAVKCLRDEGVSFKRWVPFIHYGV
jgi:hypothetical protein